MMGMKPNATSAKTSKASTGQVRRRKRKRGISALDYALIMELMPKIIERFLPDLHAEINAPAKRATNLGDRLAWNAVTQGGFILIAENATPKLSKALGPLAWGDGQAYTCNEARRDPASVWPYRKDAEAARRRLNQVDRKIFKVRRVLVEIVPDKIMQQNAPQQKPSRRGLFWKLGPPEMLRAKRREIRKRK